MKDVILIVDNIRSTHNVGAFFRTADCLGATGVYLCGITPYPQMLNDERLPHLAAKISDQIHKTALGAEQNVHWRHFATTLQAISEARANDYTIAALEQDAHSVNLKDYKPAQKIALVVGPEVTGMDQTVLQSVDVILEIPMFGKKESLNVSVAAGIALYSIM